MGLFFLIRTAKGSTYRSGTAFSGICALVLEVVVCNFINAQVRMCFFNFLSCGHMMDYVVVMVHSHETDIMFSEKSNVLEGGAGFAIIKQHIGVV